MARYTGPKSKIARRFREPIFGADKSYEKKNYPPGMHGQNRRRAKVSEYGIQFIIFSPFTAPSMAEINRSNRSFLSMRSCFCSFSALLLS